MLARVGKLDIGYDRQGDGPPILMLHAFPFDRRMWQGTAAALAGRHTVLTIDCRGFGESAGALGKDGRFSIEDLADDTAGLMDALGLERAALAGLSMGGYVALAFAHRHGARLRALVLCDTRAGADSPEGRRGRDDAIALVRSNGAGAYLDGTLPKLVAKDAAPATRARVRALAATDDAAVTAGLAALRDRPDRSGELGSIRCPTLVLVGAADGVTPPAEARAMASAIPGARLYEIPGAGHLSSLEAPAAFETALLDFLDAAAA